MRTSETTNLLLDTNITQSTRDAYRARHLVMLPSSTRIKDGAGTIIAEGSRRYDEYSLVTVGTVSGWTDPLTSIRGNLTSRGNWLNTTGNELQSHNTYDQFGNSRTATDAKGNQTSIGYSSNNTYPTTLTTPVPDPTGQYGSSIAFTTTTACDVTTGLVTSTTNANNQTTSMAYDDPLNRLTQITQPNGGRIRYSYFDSPTDLYVKVLTDQDSLRAIETRTYFDGLGRATRSFLYEGTASTPWIAKDTYYDAFGRVSKLSNPYRVIGPGGTLPSSCFECTTTAYDVLDRVVSVITPDNAQVTTSYAASTSGTLGSTVLVTDQAGKARKTVTDALGRLLEVYEDPNSLNYKTVYTYDVLDNLRTVTQDTQPQRNFAYDSLSRLRSTTNPESGQINYQYDDNGNLTQKTDARGVVSIYNYDALNRIKTIDYSDTTTINPDVSRFYDGATNGKGRPWYSYAGGNQTVGNNVEKTLFDNYDGLGRPGVLQQSFKINGVWSSAYQVSRTYNLGGAVAQQTYPSGHTVTYNYDAAGRLADKDSQNLAFSGNLGDNTPRTYARGITYAAAGEMTQEQFGTLTPVYHKLSYNSRQQLAEMIANITGDSSWNRGKIVNGYSLQCSGAACNATDDNGQLRKQETYIPANDQVTSSTSWYQQYDYDELNRLKRVHEYTGNTQLDWQQEYVYDRWGNRRIDTNAVKTFGSGINNKDFDKEDATNRLYAPADLALQDSLRRMRYDAAGNQIRDTYTGYGDATFDAENRITAIQDNLGGTSTYTYNADGQRTRRKSNNQETWQIYGFDGQLLAEYPANGTANNPTKEYGYRNDQLLVTSDTSLSDAIVWTSVVGVTVSGNSLSKVDVDGWNAGAVATQTINSGDGYVEVMASETNKHRRFGLSNGNTNQSWDDIDFCIYLEGSGTVYINEGATPRGSFGSYAAGDVFRVAVEGGVVKYRKNGVLLYTSTVSPTYPLLVDTALYSTGATLTSAVVYTGAAVTNLQWLITDHLGTPRMIFDESGSLANVKRHDYLPFGEELITQGLRSQALAIPVVTACANTSPPRKGIRRSVSITSGRATMPACRDALPAPTRCSRARDRCSRRAGIVTAT